MNLLRYTLFLLSICSYAQNIDLKWSENTEIPNSFQVLGMKNGIYYTSHIDKESHLIFRLFNKELKLINTFPVNFDLKDKETYVYDGSKILKDGIVHYLALNNSTKSKDNLFMAVKTSFDFKTIGKTMILDEQTERSEIFGARTYSPDTTKVAVFKKKYAKKKEHGRYSLKLYNSDLNKKLLEKNIELPYKDENVSRESIEVDNYGNMYLYLRIKKDKKEKEKRQSEFYDKVIVINHADGSLKEFDLKFQERNILGYYAQMMDDNTLVLAGLLQRIKGAGSSFAARDMYISVIDCKTLTVKSAEICDVSILFPQKVKKNDNYPFSIRNIFLRKDGGYSVVAEQYLKVIRSNGQHSTTTTEYFYDAAVINVKPDGRSATVSKMPKMQRNSNNPSINSFLYNDNVYMLFDDLVENEKVTNDENINISSDGLFSSITNKALYLLTVSPTGEQKKQILYKYSDLKIRPSILNSKFSPNNKFLFYADEQVGVMTIN